MKRKFIFALLLVVCTIVFSSCKSVSISQAYTAYNEKDYQKVIDLLENVEDLDNATARIQALSEAYLAYSEEEYALVIESLSNIELVDQEHLEMLAISKGMVSYQNQEYQNTIDYFATVEDGRNIPEYKASCEKLIEYAFDARSVADIVRLNTLNEWTGEQILSLITAMCQSAEYADFLFADELVKELPESELRGNIQGIIEKYEIDRAKSFLFGDWEWESGDDVCTSVKVYRLEDGLLAEVLVVGDNEVEYQILVGDIYWKDFEFIDGTTFICNNLCKTRSAIVVDVTAMGKINYEDECIEMHLTAPAPYIMVNADRKWKKLT